MLSPWPQQRSSQSFLLVLWLTATFALEMGPSISLLPPSSLCINSVAAPAGKNVRRSIQGVGQMMSTMVLSRKQSIFSPPSLSAGSTPEPVDRGRSIENENIVVMETKLKILEILQVGAGGASWSCGWDLWDGVGRCSFLMQGGRWCDERSHFCFLPSPILPVHPEREAGLQDLLPAFRLQEGVCGSLPHAGQRGRRDSSSLRLHK